MSNTIKYRPSDADRQARIYRQKRRDRDEPDNRREGSENDGSD
jgi:hypothetical protein